nr:hypothetical protein [Tanacetum cinerariifolium]
SSPGIAAAGDPESENASSPAEVGFPGSVYQPEWGVTNGSLLDTPEACQYLVDHAAPPGYFFELRHMRNEEFIRQYNVNLARQVAMGVPATVAFGAGQAEETATMDPHAASESRKRGHDGTDVNAPQSHCGGIMLTHNPQGAPMGGKSCCHTTRFGVYRCA